MTDLTIIRPVSLGRPALPSIRLPNLGIGLALAGTLEAFGHALDLGYGAPFRLGRSQSQVILEGSEKGRDPNW